MIPYSRPKLSDLYTLSQNNCLKTIPFTAAHTYKAHSEVERERDFSPVFPNLPDASQKSIITVLKQAKPGSLYLLMSVK